MPVAIALLVLVALGLFIRTMSAPADGFQHVVETVQTQVESVLKLTVVGLFAAVGPTPPRSCRRPCPCSDTEHP